MGEAVVVLLPHNVTRYTSICGDKRYYSSAFAPYFHAIIVICLANPNLTIPVNKSEYQICSLDL